MKNIIVVILMLTLGAACTEEKVEPVKPSTIDQAEYEPLIGPVTHAEIESGRTANFKYCDNIVNLYIEYSYLVRVLPWYQQTSDIKTAETVIRLRKVVTLILICQQS